MHLESLIFEELVSKGVCEKLARILDRPEDYHPHLGFNVRKVDWDYFIPEEAEDVVPLWDENADAFVRWKRNGKIEYVWLFHDDKNWSLVAVSEQGLKAELWRKWSEHQEDDAEMHRFADAIAFEHCDEALRIWETGYDAFQKWKISLEN